MRIRELFHRSRVEHGLEFPSYFSQQYPRPQEAVDLFKGDWAFRLPLETVVSGPHDLFEDARVQWFLKEIGGVEGRRVLELGPLEGAHSLMLEQAGAAEVVSIESNARAFLKCLVVKELMGMVRTRFLFGDFMAYLRASQETFDAALACGVLYHLKDPHEIFTLLAQRCTGPVMLWTHYWSQDIANRMPNLWSNFSQVREVKLPSGAVLDLHRHEYQRSILKRQFWGGNSNYSEWLSREALFVAVAEGGYRVQSIAFDEPHHPNGPAIAMVLLKP